MTAQGERLKGELTTFKIVVTVIAAAAPMGAIVGIVPLGLAIGSGASTPVVFVVSGLVLLCFSVGYAAMSKRMSGAGGFYTYVAKGLGRPPAMAAATIAIIAYNALTLLLVAGVGYFGTMVVELLTGATMPWWALSAVAIVVVGFLGLRAVDIASTVLAVLLSAEVLTLVILDIAIVAKVGLHAFPVAAMNPVAMFSTGSIGLGLMFAFTTFLGFESAAVYAEECADPVRAVPRATYIAVIVIAAFYAITSWVTVGALGADKTQAVANEQQGSLYFGLSDQYASSVLTKVMYVTLITSLFASMLALHNAASRYMYAVGRERALLPAWIGRLSRRGTPARASAVQTTISVVVVAVFAIARLDPYRNMATIMTGLGTLGLIILWTLSAIAIIGYFWRRADRPVTVIAGSAIGLVLFVITAVLIVMNFETLAGSTSPVIRVLPWVLIAVSIVAGLHSLRLRKASPTVYAAIGSFGEEPTGKPPKASAEATESRG
ncbi:APC family permease [Amycolatopsis pithecellobii]|uniref:Amino acid permease n=1 Tax=Amycolatopsis pithecellobii TaxID=664692 RepID=A0A6N7YQP9_9PSEU|nr:APC family permease [Amycolatopsis pithecellobii]MTD54312.1 amino acid permease [Amycolatopsis pithecellobii]